MSISIVVRIRVLFGEWKGTLILIFIAEETKMKKAEWIEWAKIMLALFLGHICGALTVLGFQWIHSL